MKLEELVEYCRGLPFVIEDVKWGNDLVFSIDGGKMFCVFSVEQGGYGGVSFKVEDHRFLELTDQPQFVPAPYMARAKWVKLVARRGVSAKTLQILIERSHHFYFGKLTKKRQRELLGSSD